jgi:hypothetical protein
MQMQLFDNVHVRSIITIIIYYSQIGNGYI